MCFGSLFACVLCASSSGSIFVCANFSAFCNSLYIVYLTAIYLNCQTYCRCGLLSRFSFTASCFRLDINKRTLRNDFIIQKKFICFHPWINVFFLIVLGHLICLLKIKVHCAMTLSNCKLTFAIYNFLSMSFGV